MNFIIFYNKQVFYREDFDIEKDYREGMVVINKNYGEYTANGQDWDAIDIIAPFWTGPRIVLYSVFLILLGILLGTIMECWARGESYF